MISDIYAELDKFYRFHPQYQYPLLLEEVSNRNRYNPIQDELRLPLWDEVRLLQAQQLIGPGPSLQETVDSEWNQVKEQAKQFIKAL